MFEDISIKGRLKTYFFRGLAVLLPSILTIWIFVWGYRFIQDKISIHIKHGLVRLIILAGGSEEELATLWIDWALSIAGFLIALVAVCIIGAILASVVGKTLWRSIEKFIMNTPLLRRVYPYVKQITDFFLTEEEHKKKFSRVVAVEYPRKGVWSIGFVTGSGIQKVSQTVEEEFLTVLIPNSPTPVTGYVILVPKEQTIPLDMTVEEAFRFAVSAGVITPSDETINALIPKKLNNKENKKKILSENK
ncbi:MAG: DUF502 domain-containing protein [Planctomycetota bacterium]